MVTKFAGHPVQAPDVHTGMPWYVGVGASLVLAILLAAFWLAVWSHHKDRRQRARHAADRSHRQARLAAVQESAPDPKVLVAPDVATLADLGAPTRVIRLGRGRHAAPSPVAGRARIFTTAAGRRFAAAVRHDGGPRA